MDTNTEKRKAIRRRIEVIETLLDSLIMTKTDSDKREIGRRICNLELELQILRTYYENLDCLIKNPNYLNTKSYKLKLNSKLLDQLDKEIRISLLCLTEGLCGI